MVKLKPCPMKGCKRKWLNISGLGQHLFNFHNRADMIEYILRVEAELLKLEIVEAHV